MDKTLGTSYHFENGIDVLLAALGRERRRGARKVPARREGEGEGKGRVGGEKRKENEECREKDLKKRRKNRDRENKSEKKRDAQRRKEKEKKKERSGRKLSVMVFQGSRSANTNFIKIRRPPKKKQ